MNWIEWDKVFVPRLLDVPEAKNPQGNNSTSSKKRILDLICAFDIETSRVPGYEESVCYHWQMQCGLEHPTIYGRELWQFRKMLDTFAENIEKGCTLLIFVHNLSYEFHFIRDVFPELREEDVFSLKPRKPVKVKLYSGKIELRCSYILTNMSLSEWTAKMKVEHQKLEGDKFDYNAIRFPWTVLTPEQKMYCQNDVVGLVEAMQVQLSIYGDTLSTVPLTSTGYVRRDVKRVMKNWSYYGLQNVQPEDEVYVALREAFRGGNTHANRYFAGVILSGVKSADKSSAYPDADVNYEFPMGKFKRSARKTVTWVRQLMKLHRALLIRMKVTNLRLIDEFDPIPYISFAKVRGVELKQCYMDNGRILKAPGTEIEMTVTDIDFGIIEEQYTWDHIEIIDLWETRYGYLPDMLRNLIISYYTDKTKLKGGEGQEVYYTKSKNLLNSIYGLQAQDPCKMTTVYDPEGKREKLPEKARKRAEEQKKTGKLLDLFYVAEGDIPGLLAKSRRFPYGSYQWGVWTTCICRRELQRICRAAGDNFVYCDTDSVKYIGDISAELDRYNAEKIKQSKFNGAYATDPSGVVHYMGVFEDEGEYGPDGFVTLGAKKYACRVWDKKKQGWKLVITVAGVGKKEGAKELEAAGGLPAFKTGFTFVAGGGTEAIYNDHTNKELEIDGHRLHVGSNIYLKPSTYTLGVTGDYMRIIDDTEFIRGITHEKNIRKALIANREQIMNELEVYKNGKAESEQHRKGHRKGTR